MRCSTILMIVGVASVVGAISCKQHEATTTAAANTVTVPTLRVGTYDSRAVAVASREHPAFREPIAKLIEEEKAAKAAGDEQWLAKLHKKGQALQTLRHQQGFSIAPVDDLLEKVKDKFPEVAAKAGVDVIIARPDYLAPGVETVDVTDEIVALFTPSEQTAKVVGEIHKHKPITLLEALLIED